MRMRNLVRTNIQDKTRFILSLQNINNNSRELLDTLYNFFCFVAFLRII